jgi:hypothetical protein
MATFGIGWTAFDLPTADDVGPDAVIAATDDAYEPLHRIPVHVRDAVLAVEEPAFYSSLPISWETTLGLTPPTISEQYIELLTRPHEPSILHSLEVAVLAAKFSGENPKDAVLERV